MKKTSIFGGIALLSLTVVLSGCSSDSDRQDQPNALLDRYDSLMSVPIEDDVDVEPVTSKSGGFESGSYSYNGTINGKLAIEMNINVGDDGTVTGEYWYTKNRIPIEVRRSVTEGVISLEEFSEGARTGIFSGSYQTTKLLTGSWSSPDGKKTFPFTLARTVDNTPIAMENPSPPSTPSTPTKTARTDGTYTIDQYLDDYERYLLTAMKSMKKMQANDPSGLEDYTNALQQAQSMSQKLNGMQGEMEPRHIKRLMELNERVAKASQGL